MVWVGGKSRTICNDPHESSGSHRRGPSVGRWSGYFAQTDGGIPGILSTHPLNEARRDAGLKPIIVSGYGARTRPQLSPLIEERRISGTMISDERSSSWHRSLRRA